MNADLQIVTAGPSDVGRIAPLFDGYRQFYKQPSDVDACRRYLHDRLTRGESVVFLASLDGRAVGFAQLYPTFSSLSLKPLWVLNDLFVAPGERTHGVGSALLEHARQHALSTGAKGLSLATAIDNFTAQRVYEKLGWLRDTAFYHYSLTI